MFWGSPQTGFLNVVVCTFLGGSPASNDASCICFLGGFPEMRLLNVAGYICWVFWGFPITQYYGCAVFVGFLGFCSIPTNPALPHLSMFGTWPNRLISWVDCAEFLFLPSHALYQSNTQLFWEFLQKQILSSFTLVSLRFTLAVKNAASRQIWELRGSQCQPHVVS